MSTLLSVIYPEHYNCTRCDQMEIYLFIACVLYGCCTNVTERTEWYCEGVTVYIYNVQLDISLASFSRALIGSCVCYIWI